MDIPGVGLWYDVALFLFNVTKVALESMNSILVRPEPFVPFSEGKDLACLMSFGCVTLGSQL